MTSPFSQASSLDDGMRRLEGQSGRKKAPLLVEKEMAQVKRTNEKLSEKLKGTSRARTALQKELWTVQKELSHTQDELTNARHTLDSQLRTHKQVCDMMINTLLNTVIEDGEATQADGGQESDESQESKRAAREVWRRALQASVLSKRPVAALHSSLGELCGFVADYRSVTPSPSPPDTPSQSQFLQHFLRSDGERLQALVQQQAHVDGNHFGGSGASVKAAADDSLTIASLRKKLKERASEARQLHLRNQQLEEQLESQQQAVAGSLAKLRSRMEAMEGTSDEVVALRARVSTAEQERERERIESEVALRQMREQAQSKLEEQSQNISEWREKCESAEQSLAEAGRALANERREKAGLEHQHELKMKELSDRLAHTEKELQMTMESHRKRDVLVQTERIQEEKKQKEREVEKEQLEQRLGDKEQEIALLKKQMASAREAVERLNASCNADLELIDSLHTEVETLQEELNAADDELEALREEVDQIQAEMEQQMEEKEEEIAALKADVETLTTELKTLQADYDKMVAESESAHQWIAGQQKEHRDAAAVREEAEREKRALDNERQELEKEQRNNDRDRKKLETLLLEIEAREQAVGDDESILVDREGELERREDAVLKLEITTKHEQRALAKKQLEVELLREQIQQQETTLKESVSILEREATVLREQYDRCQQQVVQLNTRLLQEREQMSEATLGLSREREVQRIREQEASARAQEDTRTIAYLKRENEQLKQLIEEMKRTQQLESHMEQEKREQQQREREAIERKQEEERVAEARRQARVKKEREQEVYREHMRQELQSILDSTGLNEGSDRLELSGDVIEMNRQLQGRLALLQQNNTLRRVQLQLHQSVSPDKKP